MDSSSSHAVEDATGTDTNVSSPSEYSVPELPDVLPACSELKEKSKINVSECEDLYYNMQHAKRGLAVVFNHEVFDRHLDLNDRTGTKFDRDNLDRTLSSVGFDVIIRDNLSFKELKCELDEVAATNFEDYACLLIVFLTHGEDRDRLYAKDNIYVVNNFFNLFIPNKCPSLKGKPKLFIIQACRGKKLDAGVEVHYEQIDSGAFSYQMPSYSDFLFAYSHIPGYFSWRNKNNGSWFIQSFCEQMDEHWKNLDFQSILTLVNQKVAYDFESYRPLEPWLHNKKQTSTFTSQLTRILQFHPKTIGNDDTAKEE